VNSPFHSIDYPPREITDRLPNSADFFLCHRSFKYHVLLTMTSSSFADQFLIQDLSIYRCHWSLLTLNSKLSLQCSLKFNTVNSNHRIVNCSFGFALILYAYNVVYTLLQVPHLRAGEEAITSVIGEIDSDKQILYRKEGQTKLQQIGPQISNRPNRCIF
jgi:hypothetical protein